MNDAKKGMDMTAGPGLQQILVLSGPIIAGYLFQQLYSMIDAAVIGNYVGVKGFAAISCASWVIWLINAAYRDFSNAFCILASRSIGKQDYAAFRALVVHAMYVGLVFSTLMITIVWFGMQDIMQLLNVDSGIRDQASAYLRIMICTVPLGFCFHMIAGFLRAAGNSHVTFYAMAVSTLVNIALDLLFVIQFHHSIEGAAVATWIAQFSAMLIALFTAWKSDLFHFEIRDFPLRLSLLSEVEKLWIPFMLNSLVITAGGMYVQKEINAVGAWFTAGYEASMTMFSIMESIILAIQSSHAVFIGQNLGARRADRIRTSISEVLAAAMGITCLMIAIVWFASRPVMVFLLKSEDPLLLERARECGVNAIRVHALGMLVMTPMYLYRSALSTMGHPNYAAVGAVVQMAARILVILYLPGVIGEYGYYLPTPVAWLFTLPIVKLPYDRYIRELTDAERESPCRTKEEICESNRSPV